VGDEVDVPGYDVGQRIGSGGFGEVYQARHALMDREVAIKVLHARYSADPAAVARFVDEARAVGKLSHPGIVDVFDFGQLADGRQFCVMELIRGRALREVLRERGRLPLDEALPILRGIAEAVDAAHAAGIAHRDLKPDNVFVLDDGGVKLIDFGLAKLTRDDGKPVTESGSVFGTPLYMSPEQCRGKAVTTATDAYSFGVLAYQVLTGEPPFQGDSLELALHHLNDAPEPPSKRCAGLAEPVDRALLALLAKDPAARPAPLVAAVDAMAGARLRRRRRAWPAFAAAGAIAACVIGWQVVHHRSARDARGQTLAVLGFANQGDADHGWVSIGLAQMVSTALASGGEVRVPDANTVAEELEELAIAPSDALSREQMAQIATAFAPDYVVVGAVRPHAGMVELDVKLLGASRELVAEAREDVPEAALPQAAIAIAARLRDALGIAAIDQGAASGARKLWPTRVEAMRHYAVGMVAELHEDHAKAIDELVQVTALEPDFALGHYYLGLAYGNEQSVHADGELERAQRLSDGLPARMRFLLDGMRKLAADPVAADESLRRAYELDPQDLYSAGFYEGVEEQRDLEQAKRVLATLRALPPPASSDPNLDLDEARIAMREGQLERCLVFVARSEAQALRAHRPNMFLDARSLELECLRQLGKLDEILALVDDTIVRIRASRGKPWLETTTLRLKCIILWQRGQLADAEQACRDAVAAMPGDVAANVKADVYAVLTMVLERLGKREDAKAELARATRACTDARPPCADRSAEAEAAGNLRDVDTQRAALLATIEAAKHRGEPGQQLQMMRNLAKADWEQLRSVDDATAEARDAVAFADAHPALKADDRADAYRLLGWVLGDAGLFDEAIAARQRALDILKQANDDTRWHFSHAGGLYILVMAARHAEAEQWAGEVLVDRTRDDARALLVEALVAQGKLADARAVVGELVGNGPEATFARAWLAVHDGKPARDERHALATRLAELKDHGKPLEIARLELRLARLAVATGDSGSRDKLRELAGRLRKLGLAGLATVADREAK
jgi:tRNA A-37 threonylcarbamoyl transferase component Bud32/tetratricopeptide (TPR) repeat protein